MPHAQVVSSKYILVCEEADIAQDVGEDLQSRVMCMANFGSDRRRRTVESVKAMWSTLRVIKMLCTDFCVSQERHVNA